MSPDPDSLPIAPLAFERRKAFAGFTEEDAALLHELRETFAAHADAVVAQFYAHLDRFEEVRGLLVDEGVVERLRQFQKGYLLSLTSGDYGQAHTQNRLRIGHVHLRIGLEPHWYLGTYGLYLRLLQPLIDAHFATDRDKATKAMGALSRLLILDMQLVLDAYYGLRQRQAVQRSEHLAAVGELAASIAHEVRNPLAGMKGALEVLQAQSAVAPQYREVMDELLAQIDRLEALVRDLLSYARPTALDRHAFDLHELLDRLLRQCMDDSESRQVTVQRAYGPGTGRILADPRQLEQVFLNLIVNALQAMDSGGALTVNTQVLGEEIAITIEDSGRGIPTADMPRVFQPFFTTKHRGSGLGLPIVKKIVEAHGGTLQLASEPGQGTRVQVRLPAGGAA